MRLSQKVFWIFFSITFVTLLLAANQFATLYAQKNYNHTLEQVNQLQSQVRQLDKLHLALFQPSQKFDQEQFDLLIAQSSETSSRLRSELVRMPQLLLAKLDSMAFHLNNFSASLRDLAESREAIDQLETKIHAILRNLHLHEEFPAAHASSHRIDGAHQHELIDLPYRTITDLQLHFQVSSFVHHHQYQLLPVLKNSVDRIKSEAGNSLLGEDLDRMVEYLENYYRQQLKLEDRRQYVEAAAENFNQMTREMLASLKKVNDQRQKVFSQLSLLVSFIGVLAAVFYWYRIRSYIRRFLFNQSQVLQAIQTDSEGVRLIPQGKDELGNLTNTLKDLSVELKSKKADLLASEQKYRSLVETLNEWIWETNINHRFSYCSTAVETITGYSQAKMLGRKYLVLSKECEEQEPFELIEQHFRERSSFTNIERQILCADGSLKHLMSSGSPLFDSDETFLGFRGVDRDITELVVAREEQEQLESKLLHAQKMESIGRLTGGIAHDFNNILSAIIGYSELVLNRLEKDHKCYKHIAEIRNSGERAAGLTKQLLAFSRKQVRTPQHLDIAEQIKRLEDMLRRLVGEQIEITINIEGTLWPVLMDKSQFEQIVVNLAVNAKDAMPNGGRLNIRMRNCPPDCQCRQEENLGLAATDYVELTVADTGSGIPAEVIDSIFDPFFTTKEKDKGTGLGLAMVYGIVNQNNGEILVDSELGKGTSFRVLLPRTTQEPPIAQPGKLEKPVRKGKETVLFVEDEEALRNMHTDYLKSLGYQVLTAGDGVEGVEKFRQQEKIDLLITDVVMPRMGGIELARTLTDADPELKVLYTSGYTDHELFVSGELEEGRNFIYKPATPLDIVNMMEKLLD